MDISVGRQGSRNKNLEQIAELSREEGKLQMPQHQRSIQLLKVKRESEKHSDLLNKLGGLMNVSEFDAMTGDKMVIHLFAECADSQMARLALIFWLKKITQCKS